MLQKWNNQKKPPPNQVRVRQFATSKGTEYYYDMDINYPQPGKPLDRVFQAKDGYLVDEQGRYLIDNKNNYFIVQPNGTVVLSQVQPRYFFEVQPKSNRSSFWKGVAVGTLATCLGIWLFKPKRRANPKRKKPKTKRISR